MCSTYVNTNIYYSGYICTYIHISICSYIVTECMRSNGICMLFVFTQHYVIFAEITLNANIYSFDFNDLWVIN